MMSACQSFSLRLYACTCLTLFVLCHIPSGYALARLGALKDGGRPGNIASHALKQVWSGTNGFSQDLQRPTLSLVGPCAGHGLQPGLLGHRRDWFTLPAIFFDSA